MIKRFSTLAAVVLGAMGVAQMASAATISFSTVGVPNPLPLGNGISVTYAGSSLSFDTTLPPALSSPFAVDYGTFTVDVGAGSNNVNISSDPYTIDLTVTAPGAASGSVIGEITGTFKKLNNTLDNDTLQFLFVPNAASVGPLTFDEVGIGTITWTFNSTNIGSSGRGPTYAGDLLGMVSYTPYTSGGPIIPLPASALSGSALLGLIFVAKARGRRNAV